MRNITSSSSTLGAAAAAGVTITAVPKSPHSELAPTDSTSVSHASSPSAIVSQPFAVATPATVPRSAAGENPNSLIAAVPPLCTNKAVSESADLDVNFLIAAFPPFCTNKVVSESADLDEKFLIAAVPPLCEIKVVSESAESLIAAVPPLCEIKVVSESADLDNTLVSKSADLSQMKTLIAAVKSLCTNKEVIESSDLAVPAAASSDLTGISDRPGIYANKEVIESSDLDGCAVESFPFCAPVSPNLAPSLWETGQNNSPNREISSNIENSDTVALDIDLEPKITLSSPNVAHVGPKLLKISEIPSVSPNVAHVGPNLLKISEIPSVPPNVAHVGLKSLKNPDISLTPSNIAQTLPNLSKIPEMPLPPPNLAHARRPSPKLPEECPPTFIPNTRFIRSDPLQHHLTAFDTLVDPLLPILTVLSLIQLFFNSLSNIVAHEVRTCLGDGWFKGPHVYSANVHLLYYYGARLALYSISTRYHLHIGSSSLPCVPLLLHGIMPMVADITLIDGLPTLAYDVYKWVSQVHCTQGMARAPSAAPSWQFSWCFETTTSVCMLHQPHNPSSSWGKDISKQAPRLRARDESKVLQMDLEQWGQPLMNIANMYKLHGQWLAFDFETWCFNPSISESPYCGNDGCGCHRGMRTSGNENPSATTCCKRCRSTTHKGCLRRKSAHVSFFDDFSYFLIECPFDRLPPWCASIATLSSPRFPGCMPYSPLKWHHGLNRYLRLTGPDGVPLPSLPPSEAMEPAPKTLGFTTTPFDDPRPLKSAPSLGTLLTNHALPSLSCLENMTVGAVKKLITRLSLKSLRDPSWKCTLYAFDNFTTKHAGKLHFPITDPQGAAFSRVYIEFVELIESLILRGALGDDTPYDDTHLLRTVRQLFDRHRAYLQPPKPTSGPLPSPRDDAPLVGAIDVEPPSPFGTTPRTPLASPFHASTPYDAVHAMRAFGTHSERQRFRSRTTTFEPYPDGDWSDHANKSGFDWMTPFDLDLGKCSPPHLASPHPFFEYHAPLYLNLPHQNSALYCLALVAMLVSGVHACSTPIAPNLEVGPFFKLDSEFYVAPSLRIDLEPLKIAPPPSLPRLFMGYDRERVDDSPSDASSLFRLFTRFDQEHIDDSPSDAPAPSLSSLLPWIDREHVDAIASSTPTNPERNPYIAPSTSTTSKATSIATYTIIAPSTPTAPTRNTNIAPSTPTTSSATSIATYANIAPSIPTAPTRNTNIAPSTPTTSSSISTMTHINFTQPSRRGILHTTSSRAPFNDLFLSQRPRGSNIKSSRLFGFCSRKALPCAPSFTNGALRTLDHDIAAFGPMCPRATSTSRSLQDLGALPRHRVPYDIAPTTQRLPMTPKWLSRWLGVQ
jgi:hypothetical protein